MAGLLGDSMDDPRTAATMQLAMGLLSGRGIAGAAQGVSGYSAMMAQAKQQALADELRRAQIADSQSQAQERQAVAQQRQAQAAQAAAQQARLSQFNQAVLPQQITGGQAASAGMTPDNASLVGQKLPTDWVALAQRFPDQIDTIKKLAEAQNFGRQKVARTIDTIGPDGKPVTVQLDEFGQQQGKGLPQWKAPIQANLGGTDAFIDPTTLQPLAQFKRTASPDAVMTDARARVSQDIERVKADPFGMLGINKNVASPAGAQAASGVSGDAFLSTLPQGIASQVKALAEGRLQISPMTLRSPQGQMIVQAAMQYEPGTDQTTYARRAATVKDAASGNIAKSNNALNTVSGHLADLADSAAKLNNTSFPWVNSVANFVLTNAGDGRVKAFNTNLNGVANELERAYRGSGGTESDIKAWRAELGSSSSPEQFQQVLGKAASMLQSKIDANQTQIDQGMATTNHNIKALTPKAAAALAKLRGDTVPDISAPADPGNKTATMKFNPATGKLEMVGG